jgi:hypothetical protein
MAKSWGKKLTRLFVMSGWHMGCNMINAAFREFTANGWQEEWDRKTGFRCLSKFDGDINEVRRAAEANPGMIFYALTVTHDSDVTELHCGVGGRWLKLRWKLAGGIDLRFRDLSIDYVRTMPRKPSRPRSGRSSRGGSRRTSRSGRQEKSRRANGASSRQPVTSTKATAPRRRLPRNRLLKAPERTEPSTGTEAANRLVFHGLPAEVERCRELVLEGLPEAERAAAKYTTAGAEQYTVGTLEFTTAGEPAFRAFNKLVAQVPGVTVTLEYTDAKSGQRRLLRAVDGRIQEHRAV